jgi:DNA-binding PadR family transcriptional regulator
MDREQGDIEALLPLTLAVFHILLALSGGERHGYAIMREVEASTQGQLRAQGLIVEADERPDPALDDERRRYYRLTDFGQRVAAAEARRLARLVAQARERRLLDAPGVEPGIDPGLGGA